MATLANTVDPGAFAELVFASLVETARAKPTRRGGARSAGADDALAIAPTLQGFQAQYRTAVDAVMERLASSGAVADPDRQALYAIVDRLLPDVRRRQLERKVEQLLDVVADLHDPMAEFHASVAADNTAIRQHFMQAIETLTSPDVAARAGHEAKNRHQTAARWKAQRRIFAVPFQGQDRFPAFQFDADGKPLRVVQRILGILPASRTPWQIAFWFVSSNSWLGGPAPRDCLGDEAALLEAAAHENDEIGG